MNTGLRRDQLTLEIGEISRRAQCEAYCADQPRFGGIRFASPPYGPAPVVAAVHETRLAGLAFGFVHTEKDLAGHNCIIQLADDTRDAGR